MLKMKSEKGEVVLDDLKKDFKEAVDEGLKPINEKLEKSDSRLKEVESKLVLIEKLPAFNRAPAFISSEKYFGRRVGKQGGIIRNAFAKGLFNENGYSLGFDTAGFESEEQIDDFAKGMIEFFEARVKHNPEAQQKLYERNLRTKASYQEGTDSEGGYLVPDEMSWDIIKLARNSTFGLRECTVLPMSSDVLKVPKELTVATVEWDDEEGQAGQKEGTFDQATLTAKRLNALAIMSNELMADSAIDIVSLLTEQFSYAVNLELDNQILAGTGSPVSGLMKGTAGTSVVMASGSAHFSMITFDHLSQALASLEEGYLANAKWVFHRNVKHYLRNIKDSNGNHIMVQPSAIQSGTIWEFPYLLSEKAIGTSAASTVEVLFGNLKKFYIGRRRGIMSLDVDPYGKFDYYQTRFRIVTRWALTLANSSAFVTVVTAA